MWGKILLAAAAFVTGLAVAGVVYDWIQERITRRTIQKHFADKIRQAFENEDYNEVNAGLTGNITEVREKAGITYVTYEVGEKKYGVKSSEGTTLSRGEILTLSA